MNNRTIGSKGEDIACEYLLKNGYEIVERNKHFSKFCEIDIIALDLETKYIGFHMTCQIPSKLIFTISISSFSEI